MKGLNMCCVRCVCSYDERLSDWCDVDDRPSHLQTQYVIQRRFIKYIWNVIPVSAPFEQNKPREC